MDLRPEDIAAALMNQPKSTAGFQPWPTLPPMGQPHPHYLENDPTPWAGGDFPNHVTPLGIAMALLGAKGMRNAASPLPMRTPPGTPANQNGVDLQKALAPQLEDLFRPKPKGDK